mgnify:CR=1 FL=1
MKSMSSRALALALSLTVLSACGSALAAEDDTMLISPAPSGIAVQLNGEALTFTDAVPVAQDGRTFLPFRAVFEAMGAEVSNEGNTITAVRDGKTLTMTIGSTEATLTEGGASSAITMDVAPYVDSTTWRTYVPVRFAAQAFGCAVGWDQDNQTAVIVDTEKLLDAALAEHQFTYMRSIWRTTSSSRRASGTSAPSLTAPPPCLALALSLSRALWTAPPPTLFRWPRP